MSESDIIEVVNLLRDALKSKEWDYVEEAREYLVEYLDEDSLDEE